MLTEKPENLTMSNALTNSPGANVWQDDPLTQLIADLVSIESTNPDLVPDGVGESDIATFCEHWLRDHGLEVQRLESTTGRPSIVAIARGAGGGRSLMLNGHYDTVTLAGYDGDPLAPQVRDGRLHGRGSYDMKSGLAAAMMVAVKTRQMRLSGDLIVACVADEEHASIGTEEVLMHHTADAGIVLEPSGLQAVVAHKGFVWFEVVVLGQAAHGSRPDLGIDAIAKAGHVLVALERWGGRVRLARQHPLLGAGSLHTSMIWGGEEASSYPAECVITIERRTLPGETGASVETELRDLLHGLERSVPDFRWKLRRGLERSPFETEREHPIVQTVLSQGEQVLGRRPETRGEPFWTDCALMQDAGIPCFMFGAGGAGAHAAEEWVDVSSVRSLHDILIGTIRSWCA